MSARVLGGLTIVAAMALPACGPPAPSIYPPKLTARDELIASYDNGFVLSTRDRAIAKGFEYRGLTDFVGCVPEAREHARKAEASGGRAGPLTTAGVTLSFAGLGGLGGLALYNKNNAAMAGVLAGGLVVQLIGLALVGAGAQSKVDANGNAIDAMNYYNDAVGSRGKRCATPAEERARAR